MQKEWEQSQLLIHKINEQIHGKYRKYSEKVTIPVQLPSEPFVNFTQIFQMISRKSSGMSNCSTCEFLINFTPQGRGNLWKVMQIATVCGVKQTYLIIEVLPSNPVRLSPHTGICCFPFFPLLWGGQEKKRVVLNSSVAHDQKSVLPIIWPIIHIFTSVIFLIWKTKWTTKATALNNNRYSLTK